MTTVTGILRDAQQNAIPNAGVTVRYTRALVGFDGGAVAQNDRLFTTDGSGLLTMTDLIPGHYEISVSMPVNANTSQAVIRRGTMSVLDDGPMALEDALDSHITVTPSVLLQAQGAASESATSAQLSQAWAESPTPPDPDDADSKSSKTWAEASKAALTGIIWYITDDATSVTVGVGLGVVVQDPGPGPYDTVTLEVA